ncbi:twin-arginine translocation signal domain-containing protein [Chloroflexi bacterium TSY]|nr:twin-arginine translocation signal domain-containing protein [Chloroflexi bacterium TSY]
MSKMTNQLSRRDFLKVTSSTAAIMALAACAPASVPSSDGDSGAMEVPEVYLWSNMIALTRPEGSDPAKYEAVQNHIG